MARRQKTWLHSVFDQLFMGGALFLVFFAVSELFVRFNPQIIWDAWTPWYLARDVFYAVAFTVLAIRKKGNPAFFYKSALVVLVVMTVIAILADQRFYILYAVPMSLLAAIIVYRDRRTNGAGPRSGSDDTETAPPSPFPYRR